MRLRSGLGHNQAAELLSFKFGNHIFGPTLFKGAGGAEKSVRKKFPAIYFVWLRRRKSSKMNFFQVVLARIVG